jgi:recombinational DNA repair protein (RecF pathway)
MVHDEGSTRVFDSVSNTLLRITSAPASDVTVEALGGLWRLAGEIGVAPALNVCALCHKPLSADRDHAFSHGAGGALCDSCAAIARGGRRLPAAARAVIVAWLADEPVGSLDTVNKRAHQRLLREFLAHHVTEARHLKAFAVWESGDWDEGMEIALPEL